MTYRDKTINEPTLEIIEEYIKRKNMEVPPVEVFEYWNNKKWLTKNNTKVKTIEAAVSVYNSIYLNKKRQNGKKSETKNKHAKTNIEDFLIEEEMMGRLYEIYTDGSCDNVKTKVGGSGYVILKDKEVIKMKNKGFYPTTNNRMEMLSIISALNSIPEGSSAIVFTDSRYCIKVFDGKMHNKNQDLIKLFLKVIHPLRRISLRWVKGHNGNEYNEMADELAFSAYKEMSEKLGKPVSKFMLKTH